MREITQEEIDKKVEAHELWLNSNGTQGEKAYFINALIKGKNFNNRNLCSVIFRNTNFDNTEFSYANLAYSNFNQCNITNTTYHFANLKNAVFENTTLSDVDFTYSNLYKTNFSNAKIESIYVTNAIPIKIKGQKVICAQVNTSRRNNLISYWADLGIWTTGCFQGTLEGLKKAVVNKHKGNPFLLTRYARAINYILEEDKADKILAKRECNDK